MACCSPAAYYGAAINLVPILRARGVGLAEAAAVTGTLGLFAIVRRPVVGLLLDRLPTRPIGVCIFLLPSITVAVLLADGPSVPAALAASAILGFSAGGEMTW